MERFFHIARVTILLLLIPLVAMQFTDEVNWDLAGFTIMGLLLLSVGFLYELATIKVRDTKHRVVIGAAFLMGFLLIWAELAVGVFGTPFAGS